MTEKHLLKSLKNKFIFVLTLILGVCSIMFCFAACKQEDPNNTTYNEPTYSFSQDNDSSEIIANPNFKQDAQKIPSDGFPYSASNWTRGVDKEAKASEINSGIVSVTDANWEALLTKFKKDSEFTSYLSNIGKTVEDASTVFANPGVKDGSEDNYIYMLNNYLGSKNYQLGTAQKITSASKVTLEKGKITHISVDVRTANLVGYNDGLGANIRLVNTVAEKAQADFQIKNIVSNDAWTTYHLYVKPDAKYTSVVTLVFGLGFGNGSANYKDATEGTAYFDNVKIETLDTVDNATYSELQFGSKDVIRLDGASSTTFYYDMSVKASALTFDENKDFADASTFGLTSSNIEGVTQLPNSSFDTTGSSAEEIKLHLNKSSVTAKILAENLVVAPQKVTLVEFDITNKLSKFGSTNITIDVWEEIWESNTVSTNKFVKRPAVATFNEVKDDAITCKLFIKNNFENGNGITYPDRAFYIEVVVGPAKISGNLGISDYATGDVIINNLRVLDNVTPVEKDETNYELYSLYTTSPSATVNLYAGYSGDYTKEEETSSQSYSFSVTPGSVGEIVSYPVTVNGYVGIDSNSAYINAESNNAEINTRVKEKTSDGSYAGLINSANLDNYVANGFAPDTQTLKDALALDKINIEEGSHIQPLVIYNATEDNYGFVGTKVNSISAGAYASVSVNLRVSGGAVAYVYLVNTDTTNKEVLTFDGLNNQNSPYQIKVTNDILDEDGWVEVSFFIATGATAKNFRVEVWNGGRTVAEGKSQGYVLVNSINVNTSSAFAEPTRWEDAFTLAESPLYNVAKSDIKEQTLFTRQLTETEKQFNAEYPDKAVSYRQNYIWLKTDRVIYSVFNTIDPIEKDPYDDIEKDDESASGCAAQTDPSTFWLSFSTILLGAALVLAMIALITKKVVQKRRANKNDAKSHYSVQSRVKARKDIERRKKIAEQETEEVEDVEEEPIIEDSFENEEETLNEEQTLDEYVYDDVQEFGEENVENSSSDDNE